MEHYEEVLKILHEKFDWKLTDSLTTTGKKLVADTIKALKIAENNKALQLQQDNIDKNYYIAKNELKIKKYNSSKCKKCGEHIGWLGIFNEWFYSLLGIKNIIHECKTNTLQK